MLTPEQIAFELDWWRSKPDMAETYRDLVIFWGITEAEAVLEIGTGPLGGCLPLIRAKHKVSLDPLHTTLEANGFMVYFPDIDYITDYVETWTTDERFDLIICANCLDHGDSDFSALDNIYALMTDGGYLCLHVHLRRPDQLNVGHDHAMSISAFNLKRDELGLLEIRGHQFTVDPFYGKYASLVGVWRK